jgi:DNA topoisomerase I
MSESVQAYCVKCREKRDMNDAQAVFTSTGTPGTRGKCGTCGTTLFRMGKTDAHEGLPKPEIIKKPKRKSTKKRKTTKSKGRRTLKNVGKLVVVESPAKARTVGNFLGKGYTVRASMGHVRDLLVTQLSVDVENEFEPKYRVPNNKRDVVKDLKQIAQAADEIYLATDPDREGEAIAWHLIHAAEMDEKKIKRVVFHSITNDAVTHAFNTPRPIDTDLINAQQARRILDRLVGYNITQLLWDRVRNRLSAGRVQSIALRLVVDREKEIKAFDPVEYWTLDARLQKQNANGQHIHSFVARLVKIGNEAPAFNAEQDVLPHLDALERSQYIIDSVKRGTRQRRPAAPFTTSTLQQEASRRFGFNTRRTMRLAQQLYEGIDVGGESGIVGLITYMRTDSTHVAPEAEQEARAHIKKHFGDEYIPAKPPKYKTKAKSAQEAHEAVRPTSVDRSPKRLKDVLARDQFRLYQLIWERFVASQMSNAIYNTVRVEIAAGEGEEKPYLFRVSGSTIKFRGFLALYEEFRDEDAKVDEDEGRILPELSNEEILDLIQLLPAQHFTQPPPRYTEANLVRALEENGIGRPSTYAPTVAVIQDREYVEKRDKRLLPTETGETVNDLLVQFFPDILDYTFTARMEDRLDKIAEGTVEWRPMLGDFYTPFEQQLVYAREKMPRLQKEEFVGRDCPKCGGSLVIKYGRWGKFIGCSNYPECKHTEQHLERTGVPCPVCGGEEGGELVVKKTKRGRTFYGCDRWPECDGSTWQLPRKDGDSEGTEAVDDLKEGTTG